METVLITGGTGLIGQALTEKLLLNGYFVVIMSRTVHQSNHPRLSYAEWDVEAMKIDMDALSRADYIIHLAGAGIAEQRWTKRRKEELLESRSHSSALLVRALSQVPHRVKAVISASAIGWYGPDRPGMPETGFLEEVPAYDDFLGRVCRSWEQTIKGVEQLGIRLVTVRTGIVLSARGGMVKELGKALRWGIAPIFGGGKQIISWIHINDLCGLYCRAISDQSWLGVYNAVAPAPVTQQNFIRTLARHIRGKWFIAWPVPAFLLRWVLGEMSIEVLKSTRVSAAKAIQSGYVFEYPELEMAVQAGMK
ncbi:MAG: TIGR01777 family protein [Chitinophagaceae bacterium]|nr:TIGR01777 family protein [Chitinophagaceae bacterium]